jgi:single-strand DNA-binding protein
MLNRVILIGYIANDPDLKYTPSGVAVCEFRIAVNRPFKNAQGESEADFIDIVAWRQNAEFAANFLTKGKLVAVEGRLQIRSFTSQDGVRRRLASVQCDNLKLLDRRREGGDEGTGGGYSSHPSPHAMDEAPPYDDPFQDE